MRILLAALALTLLPVSHANAADCTVTMNVHNPTGSHASVAVQSRTRANPGWYEAGGTGSPWRFLNVAAGDRNSRAVTFPIVGCRIGREMRVETWCYRHNNFQVDHYNAYERVPRYAQRVIRPWGTGFVAPRDFTVTIQC